MINWNDYLSMHVVRKLKQIVVEWWGVQLIIIDDKGGVWGEPSYLESHIKPDINKLIFTNERIKTQFLANLLDQNKKFPTIHSKYEVFQTNIGTLMIVVPVRFSNTYVGSVVGINFLESESATVREEVKKRINAITNAVNPTELNEAVNNVVVVEKASAEKFQELLGLVADEIVSLHSEITERENRISELNKELGTRYKYDAMIGKSKPMQELYNLLDKLQESEASVLVQGDNGTGKELIARAIHYNSPRKDKIFITQNCSAFNENLLDSELFGHVKGAFTGAIKEKKGLFEVADGGTFFLDEIADTSPAMQVKLLRVLQEGTFLPVGSTEQRKVNVRVIAATNKDLKEMIEAREFREDLYYRINVINIKVPSLRERKDDIPILIDHFLDKAVKEKNLKPKQLAKRLLEKMLDYPWPGNVRELENEIERLMVLAGDEIKIPDDYLSPRIRDFGIKNKVQSVRMQGSLKDALEQVEREMIGEGLRRTGWNKSRLAKDLGISRAGLIAKVEKYGMDKRRIPR